MPAIMFAPVGDAMRLSSALACPVLYGGTQAEEAAEIINGLHSGKYTCIVAAPKWAIGWKAPRDCQVFFLDGFPDDLRQQAEWRVRRL